MGMLLHLTIGITPKLADGCVRAMSIAGDRHAPASVPASAATILD
jgi:hypothetical protein